MDAVRPADLVMEAVQAGEAKARCPAGQLVLRGMLAGAFLGFATSLALSVRAQGALPLLAALVFPVGFVMLVLMGLELATGNFCLLPMAVLGRRARVRDLLRNWAWVYLGNLLGSLLYALLFTGVLTGLGAGEGGGVAEVVREVARKKTLAYWERGAVGWGTALLSGVLANWMVTVGTVLAFASRSTVGKVAVMWLPILTFFALGYEHSVVNMFLIPAGMFLGAPVSPGLWWAWNQVPVTLGNVLGGSLFTGTAFFLAFRPVGEVRGQALPASRRRSP